MIAPVERHTTFKQPVAGYVVACSSTEATDFIRVRGNRCDSSSDTNCVSQPRQCSSDESLSKISEPMRCDAEAFPLNDALHPSRPRQPPGSYG